MARRPIQYGSRGEIVKALDQAGGKIKNGSIPIRKSFGGVVDNATPSRAKAAKATEPKANGMTVAKAHELARMSKMKREIKAELTEEITAEIMNMLPAELRKKALLQRARKFIGDDEVARIEQRQRNRKGSK